MESESFDRSLRSLCRRVPFQPFTVELLSGTRLEVEHPEALAVNGGTAVYIARDGTPSLFDQWIVSQLVGATPSSSQAA